MFVVVGFYPCINVSNALPAQGEAYTPESWTQCSDTRVCCLCHRSDMFSMSECISVGWRILRLGGSESEATDEAMGWFIGTVLQQRVLLLDSYIISLEALLLFHSFLVSLFIFAKWNQNKG